MTLKNLLSKSCLPLVAIGFALAAGCSTHAQDAPHDPSTAAKDPATPLSNVTTNFSQDPLYPGDKIVIQFSGVPEKMEPIETDIKDDGTVTLPDIGPVVAAGRTPGQLEKDIEKKYVPDYYTHITVNVTPPVRFIFVGGMIQSSTTGRIPYSPSMTVTRAIIAAGDFNPFADRKRVELTRRQDNKVIIVNCVQALKHPEKDPPVYPGDRIYVPRRAW